MIRKEKREAIYCLHQEGMGIRKISHSLNVSTNTVQTIIKQKGEMPDAIRNDKIELDKDHLTQLYKDCDGYVQRIHEKLTEEEGIKIGYSTLTRLIREFEIGKPINKRCSQVPDEPGAEFQHDTTKHRLKIGGKQVMLEGSIIYLRYSKIKYLKYYRSFNRFNMKCFLHEALTFWGYAAPVCIIDNTNLARLYGTGKNAVIVPEMIQFAKQYGFEFVCHEKGHANRKAGNERSFYTVETNFIPGRQFENLEDLNRQAFEWATVRNANRMVKKSNLIPAKAFEYEQAYLKKLPAYLPPPYLEHVRGTDQYGYASFDGNFVWVPGTSRHDVTILQYDTYLRVYHKRKMLGEYDLPPDGVKNEKLYPKGQSKPKLQPKYRKKPTAKEEKILRNAAKEIDDYLNFALQPAGKKRHRFIRQLYGLYQKVALPLYIKTIKRAHHYRIKDIDTIERIAIIMMNNANYEAPFVQINHEYEKREAYIEGEFSDVVDLSIYDNNMEDDNE
ncbi:MAG: integrase family protein [Candidatus Magnetoglobus multicellularis str. Araruama]|uniref:Integrase family protein n=1 Tax=Candidatus Magnetoglobus multicellularis str. Araruama TaxID=890399 RepID=A0A1V1NYJ6_9BACT|nr:MAG: integrase family protein [Candidatus Magnetoglobus multicellularis str. Araruama]